jgi:hypothetical protein
MLMAAMIDIAVLFLKLAEQFTDGHGFTFGLDMARRESRTNSVTSAGAVHDTQRSRLRRPANDNVESFY